MKTLNFARLLFAVLALTAAFTLAPTEASAQVYRSVVKQTFTGATVPTSCNPAGNETFIKTSGAGRGTYVCTARDTYTYAGPLKGSAALDFDLTSVNAQDLTITVTGAALGDVVRLGIPNGSTGTNIIYSGFVSATDTVKVRAQRVLSPVIASAALDFDLTSVATQDLTITATGASVGDIVALGVPNASVTAATDFTAWVSATNTVTVRATRATGTPNPASGTFSVAVLPPAGPNPASGTFGVTVEQP